MSGFVFYLISFAALSISVVIIAPVILVLNFTISKFFFNKDKKSQSDYLIITGLLGDASYGLKVISIPSAVFILTFTDSISWIDSQVVLEIMVGIYLLLDNSLALFSLLMVFFMTVNRFFAVMKPFKYKKFFNRSKMRFIICFVILTSIFYFITSSLLYMIFLLTIDGKLHRHEMYVRALGFIVGLWPQVQFLIVITDSVLMIYVYGSIARFYRLNLLSLFSIVKLKVAKTKENTTSSSVAVELQDLQPIQKEGPRAGSNSTKQAFHSYLKFAILLDSHLYQGI